VDMPQTSDSSNAVPATAHTDNAVSVSNVSKNYGDVEALKDLSLEFPRGQLTSLLGPSGCGKTTLLRIIAGFESVSAGNIRLYGEEIRELPANKRPVNTVFQQYSLFPHMTVAENISFGLKMQGRDSDFIRQRTQQMLELVQLGEYAKRKSAQLSGGQQQRVALARALAPQPKVLLLDEPLSALDLKLRQSMRIELKQIQEQTGITFVFVTHDQEEALTMSDRIAVMSNGQIQQTGDAHSIYANPCNLFVADFIGENNKLDAVLTDKQGDVGQCRINSGAVVPCTLSETKISANRNVDLDAENNHHGKLCIRPERLTITTADNPQAALFGEVVRFVFLGTDTQVVVKVADGSEVLVRVQNTSAAQLTSRVGDNVGLIIDSSSARFLLD